MENQGFPSVRRLKKPREFGRVYKGNQTRVKGQYFTVLAFYRCAAIDNDFAEQTTTRQPCQARLGVVASKKVSKSAVRRNRLKRLMREVFRQGHHPDAFDFVCIARPGAAEIDGTTLARELNKLWNRLHKRCEAF